MKWNCSADWLRSEPKTWPAERNDCVAYVRTGIALKRSGVGRILEVMVREADIYISTMSRESTRLHPKHGVVMVFLVDLA